MALPVRKSYTGNGLQTTLTTTTLNDADTSTIFTIATSTPDWPAGGKFYIVMDPGTSKEEKMFVTSIAGNTITATRGADNTAKKIHSAGAVVYPVFAAAEADEANQVASVMTTKGDLITTNGTDINRLAVGGTNTHLLQVDSTATNGIKWGQVATAGIADLAVTTAKVNDLAVTTGKINDLAVTEGKLADSAVTTGKIANGTIVDADVNATAAIALSKLATGALPTAITVASANIVDGTIVDGDVSATAAIALSKLATGALPTAITIASANIVDGTIVNADINASAAIVDTKLATISTAGKVSNSATTATNANTASTIVARDASGNFSAGTITANITGNVSGSSGSCTGAAASANSVSVGNVSGLKQSSTVTTLFNSNGSFQIAHGCPSTPGNVIVCNGDYGAVGSNNAIATTTADATYIYGRFIGFTSNVSARINWIAFY